MAFPEGTSSIRAHRKAAAGAAPKGDLRRGAARRDAREALGRSRGGAGTKACVIADAFGRAMGLALAPGQEAHELPLAPLLVTFLTRIPPWIVADRGCASPALGEFIGRLGARPAIPPKSNEARRSPVRRGFAPTAIASSAAGPACKNGAPPPPARPLRENRPLLPPLG